jgi:L-fuconolactonase
MTHNFMRIDAHQHFWSYSPEEYPWMNADWPIRRDYLPADLEPELRGCNLEGCVAVQARQTLEESRWLLQLANSSPIIKGVVGWVDLRSDAVEEQLAELAAHPQFVGVRHVVQDEPDDRFMLHPAFRNGISKLKLFDLTYDILIYPRQLPAAIELARSFPDQPFVLDHLAKPLIQDRTLSPWREQICQLAQLPNVFCKVSGMITEADWKGWQPGDFLRHLDVVLEAFGAERILFGSDWPVCLLAGDYRQVFDLVNDYIRPLGTEVEAAFFGGNAARFYGLR